MNHDIYRKGFQLVGVFVLFLVISFGVLSQTRVQAANMSLVSDTLSSSKISVLANHTISFRSSSGVSSGNIIINLANIISSAGSVDYTDINLRYGGVNQTLAAAPTTAANTWGVAVAGGLITLSYPASCSSPCSAISSGATVTVLVGTNANGGNAQMTNSGTAGSHYVTISAGSDVGLFAVSLESNSSVSVNGSADIPAGTTSVASPAPAPSASPSTSSTSTTPTSSSTNETSPTPTPEPPSSTPTTTPSTTTTTTTPSQEAPAPAPTATPRVESTQTPQTAPTQEPAPSITTVPIAPPESIVIPPAPVGGAELATPYIVGASNSIGGGGAQLMATAGTFFSSGGESTAVDATVTPMPFDISTVWTGCPELKKFNIVGKTAYGLSVKNASPKNPGDVGVEAKKPVTFTIHYTQNDVDIQGVIEDTIRAIAFDPEDCNQHVQFTVDTEKKIATIIATPKTFFALAGDTKPGFVEKEKIAFPTFEITPVESPIAVQDLNLKDANQLNLAANDGQFYAAQNSTINLCLSSKLFKKPVKKIILSIAATKYPLAYDSNRDCFGAKIKIPSQSGKQDIELKIIYIDDQVQIIKLQTIVTSEFQATLLNYALPFLNQIQAVNAQVGKVVEQGQPIIQTTAAITVPVVGVANPSLVTNALNWYYYINHFFSWLLSLLGIRKKRRSWGVVYNAISKTPIDLVIIRLFEKATNRLIETQVTDKKGQFSFLAAPGEYYITATKNPLVFPSKIVKGSIDGDYLHIYRKESFAISTPDQAMAISIPLDPPAFDHAVVSQHATIVKWWKTFVAKNPLAPLLTGFLISEILVLYIPTSLNYTLLGFNGFFLVTQLILGLRSEKSWGLVFDTSTLAPVPLAPITMFDAKEGKMLRTRLTDYFGRFSFLAPEGEYMLAVTKDGYQFPAPKDLHIGRFHHLYRGGPISIKGKKSIIKTNIPVVPQPLPATPVIETDRSLGINTENVPKSDVQSVSEGDSALKVADSNTQKPPAIDIQTIPAEQIQQKNDAIPQSSDLDNKIQ